MDQDKHDNNCAKTYMGAWWYHSCHDSNLNGLYLSGKNEFYGQGVVWERFRGQYYSLKTTEMKFRADY